MRTKQKVENFIRSHELITPKGKVIVGLSGGADSIALLILLHSLDYKVVAAHCNFHLRGEESNRDQAFVERICSIYKIALRTISFDTNEYAQAHQYSIEMAARELRYEWFDKIRLEEQAEVIAVAHHMNDSIETVLLNIIRGTGLKGLTGIAPKRDSIVRPLLCLNRGEIEDYLEERGIGYVDDSTNFEDEYTRNNIRLNIIPLLRNINPSFDDTLLRMSENLKEVAGHTDTLLKKKIAALQSQLPAIPFEDILEWEMPKTLLFELLSAYGFNRSQSERVYNGMIRFSTGKEFRSKNYRTILDRQKLYITPIYTCTKNSVTINEKDHSIEWEELCLNITLFDRNKEWKIPREKIRVAFDADIIKYPLTWRRWTNGDRFAPFGMNGKKKLMSDFLNELKLPISEREQVTVLCSGEEIIWVVGWRTAHFGCITPETKRVIEFVIH